jgi:hypothetical protein
MGVVFLQPVVGFEGIILKTSFDDVQSVCN